MEQASPVNRAGPLRRDLALVLKLTVKSFCDHIVSEMIFPYDRTENVSHVNRAS